jgi:hypothetical protein
MGKESLQELRERLGTETEAAYRASPFSALSRDYFLRFSRNPEACPTSSEVMLGTEWRILLSEEASDLAVLMAGHLVEFLYERMGLSIPLERTRPGSEEVVERSVLMLEAGGGDAEVPESYSLSVSGRQVVAQGSDTNGLRDGIVRLVDLMGFREAPILPLGDTVHTPRLRVRLGSVPFMGSYRDVVFLGYNAVFAGGGDLYALSRSDSIPALLDRRGETPGPQTEARRYGLRTYAFLNTRQKFPENHAVFRDHPEVRGARTWSADGEFTLCTQHPLVRHYLKESVAGIFQTDPELDGVVLITGGEGFYHCFMRPHGVEKGHTNCPRCEPIGPDRVVAELCNDLTEAVRSVNPRAEVVAWPYSAEHVWSRDKAQSGFIQKLNPGGAIFTEIEKDEYVAKPNGVNKHLWDYSIDLIGPGERAQEQIALCRQSGLSIYLKSEPELAFEAARLPHVPCMDRWAERAEALASCGADGAWVFPAFRPLYGTSAAEINKQFWWHPVPDANDALERLAARLAGAPAGPLVRRAWGYVSEAIPWSPELPPYYTGPTYLGPAHPMCVDRDAELPEVFHGYYLFLAEAKDADGLQTHPTFFRDARGDVEVFERYYRRMEGLLELAAGEIDAAEPLVDERHRLTFSAEASAIRWFYHTARTTANFYASCRLRDQLNEPNPEAGRLLAEWSTVLENERANTQAALPVARADVRLDFYYGSDHTFPHLADMLEAKLALLDSELSEVLPSVAQRQGS